MPVGDDRQRSAFTGSQWTDLCILIVLLWGQILVFFIWGNDRPWLMALFALLSTAMLVKCYMWILPLWRERRRGDTSS